MPIMGAPTNSCNLPRQVAVIAITIHTGTAEYFFRLRLKNDFASDIINPFLNVIFNGLLIK